MREHYSVKRPFQRRHGSMVFLKLFVQYANMRA